MGFQPFSVFGPYFFGLYVILKTAKKLNKKRKFHLLEKISIQSSLSLRTPEYGHLSILRTVRLVPEMPKMIHSLPL